MHDILCGLLVSEIHSCFRFVYYLLSVSDLVQLSKKAAVYIVPSCLTMLGGAFHSFSKSFCLCLKYRKCLIGEIFCSFSGKVSFFGSNYISR